MLTTANIGAAKNANITNQILAYKHANRDMLANQHVNIKCNIQNVFILACTLRWMLRYYDNIINIIISIEL